MCSPLQTAKLLARIVNYCGSCVLCAEQGGSASWHTVAKGGVLFEEGRCDVTSSWLSMSDSHGMQWSGRWLPLVQVYIRTRLNH